MVESPEKRFWTGPAWDGGSGQQAPGMAWDDFNNKRILGTVPVEADGSAYFAVPADTFVYFQLLDERGHDGPVDAQRHDRAAGRDGRLRRLPRGPPHGAARRTASARPCAARPRAARALVRPAAACSATWPRSSRCSTGTASRCHDYGKEAGEKLNLAGDLGLVFNTSYVELRSKGCVHVVGAGPHRGPAAEELGLARQPRWPKSLLDGHGDAEIDRQVQLDAEAFDRIVTWIDINAPYYPDYASAYRDNLYGRSPLDPGQLERLSDLTGVNLADQQFVAQVNFTRPELSPCLARFADTNDAAYREALSIISSGQERSLPGHQEASTGSAPAGNVP